MTVVVGVIKKGEAEPKKESEVKAEPKKESKKSK